MFMNVEKVSFYIYFQNRLKRTTSLHILILLNIKDHKTNVLLRTNQSVYIPRPVSWGVESW